MTSTLTPEQIADKLTEAQRRAIASAQWRDGDGAWQFEGWYFNADRRVRWRLCLAKLAGDYLLPWQRLTSLGLSVRKVLQDREQGGGE